MSYDDQIGEAGLDPLPVIISEETCSVHGFRLISLPRNENAEDYEFFFKCPLRSCQARGK